MSFLRELRNAAPKLFGVILIGAAAGGVMGAAMLASTSNAPVAVTSASPKPILAPKPVGPTWIPSGSHLADGTLAGMWTLPDGYSFRGTQGLSDAQVVEAADRLKRQGVASSPSEDSGSALQPPSADLTRADARNALMAALLAALCALFPVSYLFRKVRGTGQVTRARTYAAWASISSAPLFMTAIDTLLRGLGPAIRRSESLPAALSSAEMLAELNRAIGGMVGLGLWAIIITGAAFAWGRVVDGRTRTKAGSAG